MSEKKMSKEPRDEFSFQPSAKLSEYRLRQIWNAKFSDKPFPKVKAFILKDEEFERIHERVRKSPCVTDLDIIEYGKKVLSKASGFVFRSTDGEIICVREHPSISIDGTLEHELGHIYREDGKKWLKKIEKK